MKLKKEIIEKILVNESIRYLFLANLISYDTLITKDDCMKSLEILNFISTYLSEMNSLTDKIRKEIIKFVLEGKEIVNQELKKMKS
jgi:hypothetical protein